MVHSELISDRLWTLGVMGIEELPGDTDRLILRTTLGNDRSDAEQRLNHLLNELDLGPDVSGTFHEMSDELADTWRAFAKPIFIGSDLVIYPAWLVQEALEVPAGVRVITIEPGATFGLGDHPTTQASLHLLRRVVQPSAAVLDIGCGSGILGIAALTRGARTAHGIDINPAADAISTANARANSVASQWSVGIGDLDDAMVDILLDDHPKGFDVITANILAPVLIGLAPFFQRLLASDGTLIVSGILTARFDHVSAALSPLKITDQVDLDGWSAVSFTH